MVITQDGLRCLIISGTGLLMLSWYNSHKMFVVVNHYFETVDQEGHPLCKYFLQQYPKAVLWIPVGSCQPKTKEKLAS